MGDDLTAIKNKRGMERKRNATSSLCNLAGSLVESEAAVAKTALATPVCGCTSLSRVSERLDNMVEILSVVIVATLVVLAVILVILVIVCGLRLT